jgi:hypothetical protein
MDDLDVVIRRLGAAAALAAICGCSTGPVVPGPGTANVPAFAAANAKKILAKFVIRIPRKHHRGARYVSPSTQSVSIVVDPGAKQSVVNANVTPGSAGCTGGVCTIVVSVAPGPHVFNVAAYDGPLSGGVPSGNVLSQNDGYAFTVRLGAANAIGIVLDGVPSSVSVVAAPNQDVNGDQATGFQIFGA